MSSVIIAGNTSGSVTLSAPAISGSSVLTLPASTDTLVGKATTDTLTNKTLGASVVQASNAAPAFSANANSTQAISQSAWTKVTFGNEVFDTNSNFASNRFTPTVAGYYQINATVNFGSGTYPVDERCALYKNGSVYANGNAYITSVVTNGGTQIVSCLVSMNGSTDYLEIYAYTGSSGTTLYGDASNTLFSGFLARSA